jgi:hypothetical protein
MLDADHDGIPCEAQLGRAVEPGHCQLSQDDDVLSL